MMDCNATALTEEWVQEVELRYTESDKSKSDLFLYEAPIMPQPAPDFVQLCNMADSMCDAETDIAMTEEECVKIEILQALLAILPADDIPRLSLIIPEVYIGSCKETRRTSITCATPPDVPRKVPNVCRFRWQLRIVREYLIFTSYLAAKECDTQAIFEIEELLLPMMSGAKLSWERVPCKCKPSMWNDPNEIEYVQFLLSTRSEETGEIIIPQPPPDPFQHRGAQDSEDTCHCDMCVFRREQEMKPGGPHPEVDLHTVWQAFYDVQAFMEEYASSRDLSNLYYVEQRLYRITQYSIMEWFCENGLHSYSDLFHCPCTDWGDEDSDSDSQTSPL